MRRNAIPLTSDRADRCKRFKKGLREEVDTLVTACARWTDRIMPN